MTIIGKVALASLVLASGGIICFGETVVRNVTVGKVLDRAIVIPRITLNEAAIASIAHQFLNEARPYKLARLTVGFEASEIAQSLTGPPPDVGAYEYFDRIVRQYGLPKCRMGQVVVSDTAGVARWLETAIVKSATFGPTGDDPTYIDAGNSRYRLVHFALKPASDLKRTGASLPSVMHAYFKAESVFTLDDARKILDKFAPKLGIDKVVAAFRRDFWFQGGSSFPGVYCSGDELRFPTREEVESSPTVTCWYSKGDNTTCTLKQLPKNSR